MDYSKFTVRDFLADDYFLRWVNQQDPEAEKFWNLFVTLHPETKGKINQAREIATGLKSANHLEFEDKLVDDLWSGIDRRVEGPQTSRAGRSVYNLISYGIAASLLLAIVVTGTFYSSNKKLEKQKEFVFHTPAIKDFVEEVNNTENEILIHLNDGSRVSLAKGSRLKYKASYQGLDSRHVFLTGEAFFDISKDPKRPFFVHANEVVTKVLGTSFRVKAYSDESSVTVAVRSGKVSVFSPKTSTSDADDFKSEVNGVVLLPNQQVVYKRDQASFDKALVEAPLILSEEINHYDFAFEDAPLSHVFEVLQDAYGIEIIYDDDVMKGCYITAPLGNEPLFDKLKIICRTIGASYEVMDSKVVINSTGCQ
jgi:hypothetical protein